MKDRIKEFSKRLKEERKYNDLTQEAMAEKLNIPVKTYCHYESLGTKNGRQPPLETLIRICEILNTKADYLLGLED